MTARRRRAIAASVAIALLAGGFTGFATEDLAAATVVTHVVAGPLIGWAQWHWPRIPFLGGSSKEHAWLQLAAFPAVLTIMAMGRPDDFLNGIFISFAFWCQIPAMLRAYRAEAAGAGMQSEASIGPRQQVD